MVIATGFAKHKTPVNQHMYAIGNKTCAGNGKEQMRITEDDGCCDHQKHGDKKSNELTNGQAEKAFIDSNCVFHRLEVGGLVVVDINGINGKG